MGEEWKPVPGFEGLYEVSNYGKIKSLRSGKLRKPVLNKQNGYFMLFLNGIREKKCLYVHRIVALAFCYKPEGCDFVNHKDEIKSNNFSDNLEWVTKQYNNTYNNKTQRCCKPITQISKDGNIVRTWSSARKASTELGIQYRNISAVCRGLRPYAGGFAWRFIT